MQVAFSGSNQVYDSMEERVSYKMVFIKLEFLEACLTIITDQGSHQASKRSSD
ncbi:hypothetical protein SAMN05216420_11610 [Nitrosospira sp. Nl5]|nr:hypothetical protein SAMN05216420_11610 [Nitrosospira sp. Nl5]